mmetsp:Transcript_10174/g.21833  ORF Transcript_10174/g.21833 Transcript_10174/m.21833 type:complete len:87 (+) Transcript_10174:980-1240(+)
MSDDDTEWTVHTSQRSRRPTPATATVTPARKPEPKTLKTPSKPGTKNALNAFETESGTESESASSEPGSKSESYKSSRRGTSSASA